MTLVEAEEEAMVAADWLEAHGYHHWVSVTPWEGGWRVSLLMRTRDRPWRTVGNIVYAVSSKIYDVPRKMKARLLR